jgi:hypothetical protein
VENEAFAAGPVGKATKLLAASGEGDAHWGRDIDLITLELGGQSPDQPHALSFVDDRDHADGNLITVASNDALVNRWPRRWANHLRLDRVGELGSFRLAKTDGQYLRWILS